VIRRTAISLAALLAGFIILWLIVLALGVTVRLDVLRYPIETAASRALGREVRVSGPIELIPTLGPTVVVHDLRIASPSGWHGADLLQAARVEARLGVIALLRSSPCIARLMIQDVSINLQTRGDGSRNWRIADVRAVTGHMPSRRSPVNQALAIWQRELQELSLRNIVLSYQDDRTGQHYQVRFDEVSGSAFPDQALELLIRGDVHQEPYIAHLKGGNLSGLLAWTENWPLQISVSMGDASLELNGKIEASRPEQGPALDFELHGVRLPAVGESVMHGRLETSDTGPELVISEARLGRSALQGRISARFEARRPHIIAELRASTLDAAPLFHDGSFPPNLTGRSPAGSSADASGWLEAFVLDAVISVREFVHTPVAIRDASLKLSLRDGQLNAPLVALIADVPFHGELAVNRQDDRTGLELTLNATNVNAGKLAKSLPGIDGIRGKFRHIEFHAAMRAIGTIELLNGIDIQLNVTGARLSYGNVDGERPVDLTLDHLALMIPAGKEISLNTHGTLLKAPFVIEFTGGALEKLLRREEWPVDFSATGRGATLGINGSLSGARGNSQARLGLHLSGERLGDLAGWLGVSPCATTPYMARGQLIISANIRRLQFLQARLGGTRLNGDLDWSMDEQIPLLHAVLHFDALDPADLDGLAPVVESGEGDAVKKGIIIDMPILPRQVEIKNADIKLAIEEILIKPVEFRDVSLSTRIRGGTFTQSPFHVHIGTTSFQGYLDPSGEATDVVFEFEGNDRDSGNRLKDLFSTAVRWAGSAAVVPLQWLLKRELSAKGANDCRDSSRRPPDHPAQRRDSSDASTPGLH
jgi:uncharacterized protein involved in outer membrane biogenesis